MKFSVGDKMVIKRSGEEGYIVSFIDKLMAEVCVGKTTFPIHIDEIDHPYLRWFTEKNKAEKKKVLREQIPLEKDVQKLPKVASGVHLTFMPVFESIGMEEQVKEMKIFLLNQTNYTVIFSYDVRVDKQSVFSYKGIIQPFTDLYLHYLDWETMQEIPRFEWRLEDNVNQNYGIQEDVVKIRSSKLFDHIQNLQKENLPTFRYTLLEEFSFKAKEKEVFKLATPMPHTKANVRSVKDLPKYELDLHIEQLIENVKGLTNAEMLTIQLHELGKYLQLAISHKQDKMVVIHGVGKGVLRSEVQRLLKENIFTDKVESGWQAGYGFGATIAYFKY